MQTSSFKISGSNAYAVSIARWPMFWKVHRYYDLAPSRGLHHDMKAGLLTEDEYIDRFYHETLNRTTPIKVLSDLGPDAILLCWCEPGEFCHRRVVAQWLEDALGIDVPEVV